MSQSEEPAEPTTATAAPVSEKDGAGELGEGPGVVDLQRCWGFSEQSYKG